MRRPSFAAGALLGSLTSLSLIALSYVSAQWAGLPFVPSDLSDEFHHLVVWPLGGGATWLWQISGLLLVFVAGAAIGLVVVWGLRQTSLPGAGVGLLAGVAAFVPIAILEYRRQTALGGSPLVSLLWLGVLILNWGILLGLWLERPALSALPVPQTGPAEAQARRDLLKLALSSLTAAFAAWGAGALAAWFRHPTEDAPVFAPPSPSASISTPPPAAVAALPARAAPTATPVSATPRPVNLAGGCVLQPVVAPTPYPNRVKFGDLDPSTGLHVTGQGKVIDVTTYFLDVTGKVDRPLRFTYDDLRCLPKIGADVTLVCVGYFEDEAGWEGADMKALLQMAGVQKDAQGIRMTGADGYHSAVPIDTALEGGNFLAYELEGNPLPILHGFPVRTMFPALHGDIDVKWLVKIEVY